MSLVKTIKMLGSDYDVKISDEQAKVMADQVEAELEAQVEAGDLDKSEVEESRYYVAKQIVQDFCF